MLWVTWINFAISGEEADELQMYVFINSWMNYHSLSNRRQEVFAEWILLKIMTNNID